MNRAEFLSLATPLARHAITLAAGVAAAHGFATGGEVLASSALALGAVAASVGWSVLEKSKLVATLVADTPASLVQMLAAMVHDLEERGAPPGEVARAAAMLHDAASANRTGVPSTATSVQQAAQAMRDAAVAKLVPGVRGPFAEETHGDMA